MCEGIEKELEGIDLGDKRLNRCSGSILESLAANPQASINSACVSPIRLFKRLKTRL